MGNAPRGPWREGRNRAPRRGSARARAAPGGRSGWVQPLYAAMRPKPLPRSKHGGESSKAGDGQRRSGRGGGEAFPRAFAACCGCTEEGQQPCMEIEDLWSQCFRQRVVPARLAKFLLGRLGMFGIFGNVIESAPKELILDPRMSWVVNNAYRWKSAKRIAREIAQAAGRT